MANQGVAYAVDFTNKDAACLVHRGLTGSEDVVFLAVIEKEGGKGAVLWVVTKPGVDPKELGLGDNPVPFEGTVLAHSTKGSG